MYLVCNVFDLSHPPKHSHTPDIAQVTSLLPRGDTNFTAQYLKSKKFNGFPKQVCQLFSSVNVSYPDVVIKVFPLHIEVSRLFVSTFCDMPGSLLVNGTGIVDVQDQCFFCRSEITVLRAGVSIGQTL